MQGQENGQNLKSLNSLMFSYVTFISRTNRRVDILWMDYEGRPMKYSTLEERGEIYPVTTFVTHPWIFRDADTGDVLLANGMDVYFPEAWSQDNDTAFVFIGIPVYSLLDRCLQETTQLYTEDQIQQEQLPYSLKWDIGYRLNTIMKYLNNNNN